MRLEEHSSHFRFPHSRVCSFPLQCKFWFFSPLSGSPAVLHYFLYFARFLLVVFCFISKASLYVSWTPNNCLIIFPSPSTSHSPARNALEVFPSLLLQQPVPGPRLPVRPPSEVASPAGPGLAPRHLLMALPWAWDCACDAAPRRRHL